MTWKFESGFIYDSYANRKVKGADLSPKIRAAVKESFSDKLVIRNLTGETNH